MITIFTEYKYHKMLRFVPSGIEFFLEFQLQKKLAHRHGFSGIFLEIFGFLKYRLPSLYYFLLHTYKHLEREKNAYFQGSCNQQHANFGTNGANS